MKILHIYKDYYPVLGGMENHIKVLAESQVRRGHAVTVLVTHPTKITHVEMMNGVRVIKAGRLATIASTPISVSLPFLLSKERPDIAHLHSPYPIGELSQLYLGKAKKVVLTYHSDVVRQKGLLRFYKPFLKKVLSLADRIIVTSESYMNSSPHLREFMHKCTAIPLGIDLTPFLQSSSRGIGAIKEKYGSPIILFVGKLRYYKGLQFLLEAMSGIPAKLIVIGNGPMAKEWRNLASKLNINEKVFFLGEIGGEQLAHFYGASDIFVLPACERSEAFGLVQVEAMASGLPVISTELGTGTSFVNKNGETGLVVRPKDPDSLRVSILSLLDNPTLCLEMGRRGRERAMREFSLETMTEKVMNLYMTIFRTSGHIRSFN
jgi:glycosyltransferase involved in cell wall biosynthesis